MTRLEHIPDADAYNRQSIKRLVRTLTLSQGDFTLILAHCNYRELQSHVMDHVQERCPFPVIQIELATVERTLFTALQRQLHGVEEAPKAVMVCGLTQLDNLDQVLKATNQVRDEFRKQFAFPLVLWVNNTVLRQLIRLAPDVQSWATTMDFQLATSQLIAALEDGDRTLFGHLLQVGGGQFMPNSRMFGARYRRELTAAVHDLRQRGHQLAPALEASLRFVEGREAYELAYKNRNLDEAQQHYQQAIAHYQASLDFWDSSGDLKRRGCVLYHLGIAWVARGERYRAEHEVCYQTALTYFWRCIDSFVQMERPDYEARFINALCFTLQRLNQRPDQTAPQWDELERWATRSRTLQEQYQDQFRLARAYGFLSEVAIAREQWDEAKQLASQAQKILEAELANPEAGMASGTVVNLKWERSFHQGWYLLALAQTLIHLGDSDGALVQLQKARHETEVEYDPELYIRILNQLRHLYFDRKDYLTAFKLRQQRRIIEYQYNFRAFVGAGHLQPKHHITNPAIAAQSQGTSINYPVPSDFQTSGRQDDIEQLVGRIASTNHRLTIIHGQSGVGKSSILEAGLLPTLQYNRVGGRAVMPILQPVYAEWEQNLMQAIATGAESFQSHYSPEFETLAPQFETVAQISSSSASSSSASSSSASNASTSGPSSFSALSQAILTQLRWNSRHNVVTVLLFDQFEEFFFAYRHRRDRQRFYQFLKACLDISFVNVMISLREDYLHQLLEITRCIDLEVINNDILSHQTLHHIGNFSRERAKTVIRTLAARTPFQLEAALIDQLVDDLSEDTGDVSPIELQIVGSQLQTEGITTLDAYEQKGPMAQLVQRYLDEALTNCGPDYQKVAKHLLYALTDEHQLRPLRTLTELADDSGAAPQQVEMVLEILIGAGMVVEFPESSSRYYQLIHDYLVPFIRDERHADLLDTLTWTKSRLNQAMKREVQERVRAEIAEVNALNALSKALLLSHDHLNALMKGVEAAQKLQTVQRTYGDMMHQTPVGQTTLGDTLQRIEHDTVNRLRRTLSHIKEVNRLEGHDAKTFALAFHPDGDRLASGSADHTVRIWGIDGEAIATCEGHRDYVFSVAFSPDGRLLASAGADKTIRLWRSRGGIPIRTFTGHTDTICAVAFHPHRPLFASASRDGTIRLWNTAGGSGAVFRRGVDVFSLSFSARGDLLVSAYSDGKIRIWHLDGTLIREIKGHDKTIYSVGYAADGHTVVSASEDGTVKRWSQYWTAEPWPHPPESLLLCQLDVPVLTTHISPDGQLCAVGAKDGVVRLCNTMGQIVQSFRGHQGTVHDVRFSPDGRLLASTGNDKTIRLWNLDGIGLHVSQGHDGRVLCAAFGPKGLLATAGEDHTVKLWQLDGALLKTFQGHSDAVRHVCFSPDGSHLASASSDGCVNVWTVDGTLVRSCSEHYGGVREVCFSPDGNELLSAGNDRIVRRWVLTEQEPPDAPPQEFHGARARILSVAIAPNQRCIAAASGRSIILWQTQAPPSDQSQSDQSQSDQSQSDQSQDDQGQGDQSQNNQGQNNQGQGDQGQNNQSQSDSAPEQVDHGQPRDAWPDDVRSSPHTVPHAHSARVLALCFSPDGAYLATAGADRLIKLWRPDGTWVRTLRGHQATVKGIRFSPDGHYLLSYGSDRTVRIWHRQGPLLKTLRGHVGSIVGVEWQAEQQRVLSVGESSVVKGWQLSRPLEARLEGRPGDRDENTPPVPSLSPAPALPGAKADEQDHPSLEFVLNAKDSILLSDDPTDNLQQLIKQGCQWLQPYLSHNPCLSQAERNRCR